MRPLTVLLVASLCMLPATALAADYEWVGGTGDWSAAENWNPSGVPVAGDNVTISSSGTDEVTVSGAQACANITLGGSGYRRLDGDGTLTFTGTFDYLGTNPNTADRNYIKCTLAGGGEFVMDGSGAVIIHGDNTFTGGSTFNAGHAILFHPNALGTGTVTVNSGGWVDWYANKGGATPEFDNDIVLNGGTFQAQKTVLTLSGKVVVQSDSTIAASPNYVRSMTISGTIEGSAKLTYDPAMTGGTGEDGFWLVLPHANPFTGDWSVLSGRVVVEADGGLGTGTVGRTISVVSGRDSVGGIELRADQTGDNACPITLQGPYGKLTLRLADGADVTVPVVLNGGKLDGEKQYGDPNAPLQTYNSPTDIALTADSKIGGNLVIKSSIVETGGTYSLTKVGSGEATLEAVNNYSGGTNVNAGTLKAALAGCLGTGTVNVNSGGKLVTTGDNSLGSPTSVIVNAGGMFDLGSDEKGNSVRVNTGGAFGVSYSGTVDLIYSGVPDPSNYEVLVQVERGAIIEASVTDLPDLGELLPGDGGYGVFTTNAASGTFGSDSGTLYRGIAAGAVDVTFSGTATEAGSGIGFLANPGRTFVFDGARVIPDDDNPTGLYGPGEFVISGINNHFTNVSGNAVINVLGPCRLSIDTGGGLGGATLNVRNGELYLGQPDNALGSGPGPDPCTVNVEAGGSIYLLNQATEGVINVKAGGGIRLAGKSWQCKADLGGGAEWNLEPGAQIVVQGKSWPANLTDFAAADGKASWLICPTELSALGTQLYGELFLGNESRITPAPFADADGNAIETSAVLGRWSSAGDINVIGKISLAPGQTQCRFAAPKDQALLVQCQLNLGPDSTLIIGDTETYHCLAYGVYSGDGEPDAGSMMNDESVRGAFVDLSQDGCVIINTYKSLPNSIGRVDVQGGILQLDAYEGSGGGHTPVEQLGGAKYVNLRDGELRSYYRGLAPMPAIITGTGTVSPGWRDPWTKYDARYALQLQPSDENEAGLSPGDTFDEAKGVGVLEVEGDLDFAVYVDAQDVEHYSKVEIDVFGHGAVAGVDHDQVIVHFNNTARLTGLGNADLVVALPVPSGVLNPNKLGDMDIMVADVVGTGTFHSATVGETIGVPGDQHWQLKDGMDLVQYTDTTVVLKGGSLEWTAIPGDATLDGVVGIADLGALADNYGTESGANWMQGDFNFDGRVGIADLGALADHYGESEAGSAAVPEPASLALLALGGLALLRRKRR